MFAVKEAIFPFDRFENVDTLLGPEMKSTGEVMGFAENFAAAFAKAQIAVYHKLPEGGKVFISVRDEDKEKTTEIVTKLQSFGFEIVATKGTKEFLDKKGFKNISVLDSYSIRRATLINKVVYFTTIRGADALMQSFKYIKNKKSFDIHNLQQRQNIA
jgi:carbamoyl-phosphate synthase large subunit